MDAVEFLVESDRPAVECAVADALRTGRAEVSPSAGPDGGARFEFVLPPRPES